MAGRPQNGLKQVAKTLSPISVTRRRESSKKNPLWLRVECRRVGLGARLYVTCTQRKIYFERVCGLWLQYAIRIKLSFAAVNIRSPVKHRLRLKKDQVRERFFMLAKVAQQIIYRTIFYNNIQVSVAQIIPWGTKASSFKRFFLLKFVK